MYVDTTTAEVTSKIFEHWGFDKKIVKMIRFSDNYDKAEELREYSLALKIIKTAVPINLPLSERSVNAALLILEKEEMNKQLFLDAVGDM